MSLKHVPPHVRAHLYLFWVGAVGAALGIVGFFLSFGEVGAPAQATIDVHYDVPVLAYASIGAWVVGLGLMWYSRRQLNAAVAKKLAEDREAIIVDLEKPADDAVDAPEGREL